MKVQVEFFDVDLFIMMCHCRFKIEKIEKTKQNKTTKPRLSDVLGCTDVFNFQFFPLQHSRKLSFIFPNISGCRETFLHRMPLYLSLYMSTAHRPDYYGHQCHKYGGMTAKSLPFFSYHIKGTAGFITV